MSHPIGEAKSNDFIDVEDFDIDDDGDDDDKRNRSRVKAQSPLISLKMINTRSNIVESTREKIIFKIDMRYACDKLSK